MQCTCWLDCESKKKEHILTICPQDQWRGRAQHFDLCNAIYHHACVVPYIRRFYFSNVKVPSLLWDKTSAVLLDKVWVLIEHPGEMQL